jgi:hypothetical protein
MKHVKVLFTPYGIEKKKILSHQKTLNSNVPYPSKFFKPTLIDSSMRRYQIHPQTITFNSITCTFMDVKNQNCDRCLKYHTNQCKECSETKKIKSPLHSLNGNFNTITSGKSNFLFSLKNHSKIFPGEWKIRYLNSSHSGKVKMLILECTQTSMMPSIPTILSFLN